MAASPTKANVAAIMIAHTVQYQSEPRTVMAIWAVALLTASSATGVRIAFGCGTSTMEHTVDLKCSVTHIVECLDSEIQAG